MKIFWNGRMIDAVRARLPVLEPHYFNGSALIETLRVRNGHLVNLSLHLDRFAEGARVLMMPSPNLKEFRINASELLRINRFKNGSLRCRYFRDGKLLMHPLPVKRSPSLSAKGIRLLTTPVRHFGPENIQGRLKSNSMLANLLARWESQAWAEDGLRLTPSGFVAEGVWTNVLILKRGILMTPPLAEGILNGTTRAMAIQRWRAKGGKVKETPLTRFDLYTADKAWVCSSLRGLIKVAEVDGRLLG